MIVTDAQLKRLITAKLLMDHAQKEFAEASADMNMTSMDRERVVELNGTYYLVRGNDRDRPTVKEIPAPTSVT